MPTISESYDLQRMQQSGSSNKIFGRFDVFHILLAIATVIFLILSIVFIILFATKHDTSTGFLATGFTLNSKDDLTNDLKGRLDNKYTVNSFGLDVVNNEVNAIFSLRDSISADDVQKTLSDSKMVSQLEVTYGDKAYSVCHQTQLFSTTIPGKKTTETATTPAQPVNQLYCQGSQIVRDVLIVVDMNGFPKTKEGEREQALNILKNKIVNHVNFANTNIFLSAVAGDQVKNISMAFADSVNQFKTDFDNLLAIGNTINKSNLDLSAIMDHAVGIQTLKRKYTPSEVIILSDKPNNSPSIVNNPRDNGVFVAIAGVNPNYAKQFDKFVDASRFYSSWADMADKDPFSDLICLFYNPPKASSEMRMFAELDALTNSPKCEVLDIILAFDTSESLSRIILDQYKTFAKQLMDQYKYKADQNTQVGIFTFNSAQTTILQFSDQISLDIVNNAIDTVQYTAGLTDVTGALNYANDMFTKKANRPNSGRVLVVLSDAIPTLGTFDDEIAAGKKLSDNGVATFFIGYSSYTDQVKGELGQVTNPNYIFGDTTQASIDGVTGQVLNTYPCPIPKCVTTYFAVEISEATNDVVVRNLQNVLKIADLASKSQSGTESYQLITYSKDKTRVNPQNDASLASFKAFVQDLIDNADHRNNLRGPATRLDTSIDAITSELILQAKHNPRFTSQILFFGEANEAVLDPFENANLKIAQLKQAAENLKQQTGLVYVIDDSRDPKLFGDDLWTSVTSADRIIADGDDVVARLQNTDYFTEWSKLSCELPPFKTCFDTQLDIALVFDMQKKDYVFMDYIQKFLNQFTIDFDTHISIVAYGAQETRVISKLNAYSSNALSDSFVKYEAWRNGSLFTWTTLGPSTSTQQPETSTTQADSLGEFDYQVSASTISGVFDMLDDEFGCGNYKDDGDRVFAPNVYIFASNNFQNYQPAVWSTFKMENNMRFGCSNCAATPTYIFLSRTDMSAPAPLGTSIVFSDQDLDIDPSDDTSTQADINKFNSLVNQVCTIPLPDCATFAC